MQSEEYEGELERLCLAAVITNTAVCAKLAAAHQEGKDPFATRWANLAARWAVEHYRTYGVAPGNTVQDRFMAWAQDPRRDQATVRAMELFLHFVSQEWDQQESRQEGQPAQVVAPLKDGDTPPDNTPPGATPGAPPPPTHDNPQYHIDLLASHLRQVALNRLFDNGKAALKEGNLDRADALVAAHTTVGFGEAEDIDVYEDTEAQAAVFLKEQTALVKYPDAAGRFFGAAFKRGNLVCFEGPVKRGKSNLLFDHAWRASQQGLNVYLCSVGDMTREEVLAWFAVRAARHPLLPTAPDDPVRYPVYLDVPPGERSGLAEHEERHYQAGLTAAAAQAALTRAAAHLGGRRRLKLSVHRNSSLSVPALRDRVTRRAARGWVADVIVIDYADILAPVDARADPIQQIDTTWKHLRALSQEFGALVVTASQTNAASFDAETLGLRHFRGNLVKRAEATHVLGINQTKMEKANGLLRLNFIAARGQKYDERRCLHLAACLELANPMVLTCLPSYTAVYDMPGTEGTAQPPRGKRPVSRKA